MTPPARPLVLGVDGGGTKTLAWLAECDKQGEARILGRGTAGSSNIVAVGLELALENLALSVEQAFADARLAITPLAAGVFALAGSGTAEAQRQILDFLEQQFSIASTEVIHDGQAVLQAGTPDGWGIAMIAGTGAVAYGKNQQGESAVVGGWGYWFGDEGSAYWIGQAALRAVSQAADGRAQQTKLTEAVLQRLESSDPRAMLTALSSQGDTRLAIAELAALVNELAQQGDAIAHNIVRLAAQNWCQHIRCLNQKLMPGRPFPLALAGGVLCESQLARDELQQQLEANAVVTTTVKLVPEPVLGCVRLACREC